MRAAANDHIYIKQEDPVKNRTSTLGAVALTLLSATADDKASPVPTSNSVHGPFGL
jgi:hypothetical protein